MENQSLEASCHSCGAQPTIRAHIIPRSFAKHVRGDNPNLIGVTIQREYVSQSGFVDSCILCAKCDGKLGNDDKFAVEFCRRHISFNPPATAKDIEFPGEPLQLARFANAVVWRASISRLNGFREFSVGDELEARMRAALFTNSEALCDTIAFRYRVNGEIDPFEVFTYPYIHDDKSGVQFATFSLGRFRFSIRLGGEALQSLLRDVILNESAVIRAYCVDFEETTEYARMAELSRLHS